MGIEELDSQLLDSAVKNDQDIFIIVHDGTQTQQYFNSMMATVGNLDPEYCYYVVRYYIFASMNIKINSTNLVLNSSTNIFDTFNNQDLFFGIVKYSPTNNEMSDAALLINHLASDEETICNDDLYKLLNYFKAQTSAQLFL